MSGWVKVYNSNDRINSEIIKQVLLENEVNVVSMNRQDSNYHFGSIELYVPEGQFQMAIEVIIKHSQNTNQ